MVCNVFEDPTDDHCSRLFEVLDSDCDGGSNTPLLRCTYTGVCACPRRSLVTTSEEPAMAGAEADDTFTLLGVIARMRCAPTKTFVRNLARIFAAST
jgi:hypothetical protein